MSAILRCWELFEHLSRADYCGQTYRNERLAIEWHKQRGERTGAGVEPACGKRGLLGVCSMHDDSSSPNIMAEGLADMMAGEAQAWRTVGVVWKMADDLGRSRTDGLQRKRIDGAKPQLAARTRGRQRSIRDRKRAVSVAADVCDERKTGKGQRRRRGRQRLTANFGASRDSKRFEPRRRLDDGTLTSTYSVHGFILPLPSHLHPILRHKAFATTPPALCRSTRNPCSLSLALPP